MKNDIKIILFSISILLIIIISSLYVKRYLEKSSELMLSEINTVESLVNKGDWDKAYGKINETHSTWENIEGKWTLLINHHEIDDISVALKNTEEYVKEKDKTFTMSSISTLKHFISHIPQMESLSLKNIF